MEIAEFWGVRTPKHQNRLKKIGVGDYIGNNSPHAKIQNDRPIGDMAAYAWNITFAWLLDFLSYLILFCDPTFCSRSETKL